MEGRSAHFKKAVRLPLSADEEYEVEQLWAYELDARKTPQVLDSYFVALRVANMLYARRCYKAANSWASKAAERLEEAFEMEGEVLRMFLDEVDDSSDIDDEVEALPRKRRHRSRAEIIAAMEASRGRK